MDEKKLLDLLDHMELINWIHFMSYWSAAVGRTMVNMIDGNGNPRKYLVLPSGKKVVITIKVEEYKE